MPRLDALPFRLLGHRDFAWFFWGTFVSMLGMGVNMIGVNWYILNATGAETNVSLIMMTSLGAGLLILPFSGSIIDRNPRRTMVMTPDIIRAMVIGSVGLFALSPSFPIWVLWPMAFIVGSNHAFYFPASTALLQEILPPEEYMNANALREVTFQVGSLSAAGVAGWIVDTFGLSGVLLFDASTYVFSAFCIYQIRSGRVAHPDRDQGESYWGTIRSGLSYLWTNKPIFVFGIVSMMPFVAVMALNVLMPTYVKNILNQGAVTYGLMDMTYGIGAFLGAAAIGALIVDRHHQSALRILLLCASVSYFAYAFVDGWIIAFILAALVGFFNSSFRVVSQTYLMRIIPSKLMGRCTSTFFQISIVAQLSVIFGVGYIAEHVAIGAGYFVLAGLLLGAMIHLWVLHRRLPDPVVKSL